MNHIEALKICRDSLEILSEVPSPAVARECQRALAATTDIEQPVVTSWTNITLLVDDMLHSWLKYMYAAETQEIRDRRINARMALEQGIATHCAQQVATAHEAAWADAGREIDRAAKERDDLRAQLAARIEPAEPVAYMVRYNSWASNPSHQNDEFAEGRWESWKPATKAYGESILLNKKNFPDQNWMWEVMPLCAAPQPSAPPAPDWSAA